MSGAGDMDLRTPIGALFVMLGVILAGYGIATNGDATMYARSAGLNVNLIWGAVMWLFGALFLLLARRAARKP